MLIAIDSDKFSHYNIYESTHYFVFGGFYHMSSIVPLSISQKKTLNSLSMALGYQNIVTISNCMTRVRINIKDPSLLANNEFFLKLNAQGIIREDNFIHLIYGKLSAQLAFQLKLVYKSLNNIFILGLLNSLQGAKNIKSLTYTNNQITILVNSITKIDPKFLQKISQIHNVPIQQIDNSIILSTGNTTQEIFTQIQCALLFWDTIQSIFIVNFLKVSNIIEISRTNYTLKISTQTPIEINSTIWGHYGLEILPNSVSENEMFIQNISDELFDSLSEYYHFLINDFSFFDKK